MRREGVDGRMAAITFLLSGSGGSVGNDNQAWRLRVCGSARCGVARVLVDAEHLWMVLLVVLG
jgi:hypothetical protein